MGSTHILYIGRYGFFIGLIIYLLWPKIKRLELPKLVPFWINRVYKYDKECLFGLIYWKLDKWIFDRLKTTEPQIEVRLKIINASIFTILLEGVSGGFNIEDSPSISPIQFIGTKEIEHGRDGNINIRQSIAPETRDLILKKYKKGERVEICFGFGIDILAKEMPKIKINKNVGDRFYVPITL